MSTPEDTGGNNPRPQAPAASAATDAGYELVSSYSTVQVLSPTSSRDIVYCTIRTTPSGVIASMPVPAKAFDTGNAGPTLASFAQAIENVMADPRVIAGRGSQSLDRNGLLVDDVVFTVTLPDADDGSDEVTAQAVIPVSQLNFADAKTGTVRRAGVQTGIDAVAANLQALAGS